MIRRWSHLNILNLPTIEFRSFVKPKKIALFKSSVSLKRFNRGITKFKRKSAARRKHFSNWLIYLNVLSAWADDYKVQKQLTKFQYINKIFLNNSFCYNFDYIRRRFLLNEFRGTEAFFLFTALSKKIYFYYYPNMKLYRGFMYFNIAYIFTNQTDFKQVPNTLLPIYEEYDSRFFANSEYKEFSVSVIFDTLFNVALNKNVELYKLLTLFFYFLCSKTLNFFVFKNLLFTQKTYNI